MRILTVVVIGAGLILVALAGWAGASGRFTGGSSESESVSSLYSPTPKTPAVDTSSSPPDASPTAPPLLETALLYSGFESSQDTIWLAPLSNLREPQTIVVIPHASEWGISASLSPDGQQVAYVVLPPTVLDPGRAADDQAEVWVLPLAGGEPELLASGADVRSAPIWSPDGGSLVFQRFDRQRNVPALFRVNLQDKVVSPLASLEGATSVFPVAYGPRGDPFYAVRIAEGDTEVLAISTVEGSMLTIATIADGVARDWQLSPDGRRMAFVEQAAGGGWKLWVLDLEDGSLLRLEAEGLPTDRELFSPVWHPGQGLITLGTAPGDDGNGVLSLSLSGGAAEQLPGPEQGFDVPLAWSPQGDLLVVQEFAEFPVRHRPRLRLIAPDGQRQVLADEAEVTFIGWSAGGN